MIKVHSLLNIVLFITTVLVFIYFFTFIDKQRPVLLKTNPDFKHNLNSSLRYGYKKSDYNLWLIFTKVVERSPLYFNFQRLIQNILKISSQPINFHIITDHGSKQIASDIFHQMENSLNQSISYDFYNVSVFSNEIQDIVEAMTPHFSSKPGTYYSDALFYISLGLYRLAPSTQELVVMIDCDVYFQQDVSLLFEQFKAFRHGELFALAPELSPVYKHILYAYKLKHTTTFGEYLHAEPIRLKNATSTSHPNGFPGYNSGVILFNLSAIRESSLYAEVIEKEAVRKMVQKYIFRGHLGDQDFYTLLGYEHPQLIRTMSCTFNRQLCTWWRDNGGYKDIFTKYYECNQEVVVLHGNCNTRIPVE